MNTWNYHNLDNNYMSFIPLSEVNDFGEPIVDDPNLNVMDCFSLFFSDEIIQYITLESNRYIIAKFKEKDPGKKNKKFLVPNTNDKIAMQIVLLLLDGLENKGHRVFFDGWYSSIDLLTELTKRNFNFITTLRSNASNLPNKNSLENISKKYAYMEHLLVQKYTQDKKDLFFASNYKQPVELLRDDYNIENRGVDKMNQIHAYYDVERKAKK